ISPKDLDEKEYPKIEEIIRSVKEIDEKLSRVNLQLTLKSNPTLIRFPRDDGEGLVSKVKAADETGEITVVAWDEEAENLSKTSIGDKIRIINGRLRKGLNGSLEVHITKSSLLTPLGKD
ncbi:MAG: OB-fold nucleic acid binding domain-containing protein, partial [Thermoproteota archaeon]